MHMILFEIILFQFLESLNCHLKNEPGVYQIFSIVVARLDAGRFFFLAVILEYLFVIESLKFPNQPGENIAQ